MSGLLLLFFHLLHRKSRFYSLYSEDPWARMGTDCASQVRLCSTPTTKTCGWVVLHSCPWAHIHSHLLEEERGTNDSDRCLWAVVIYKQNLWLPLVMQVGYLRHLTPNLNQRKLRALISLVNQKWLTGGQGNKYESPESQSSILLISTTYKPGFGVVVVTYHSGQN